MDQLVSTRAIKRNCALLKALVEVSQVSESEVIARLLRDHYGCLDISKNKKQQWERFIRRGGGINNTS